MTAAPRPSTARVKDARFAVIAASPSCHGVLPRATPRRSRNVDAKRGGAVRRICPQVRARLVEVETHGPAAGLVEDDGADLVAPARRLLARNVRRWRRVAVDGDVERDVG